MSTNSELCRVVLFTCFPAAPAALQVRPLKAQTLDYSKDAEQDKNSSPGLKSPFIIPRGNLLTAQGGVFACVEEEFLPDEWELRCQSASFPHYLSVFLRESAFLNQHTHSD